MSNMVQISDQEKTVISNKHSEDKKDMQKDTTVEGNHAGRNHKDSSERKVNYDGKEEYARKVDREKKSYREDDYYNRRYQERDRVNRESHGEYARRKYREPAYGRERYRPLESRDTVKDGSEAERTSRSYSSKEKQQNLEKANSRVKSQNSLPHKYADESNEHKEDSVDNSVNTNSSRRSDIGRNRDGDSDRPNLRNNETGSGERAKTAGVNLSRDDGTRRDSSYKYSSREDYRLYRSREDVDRRSPQSRDDGRYSRRRRDPVGEEHAPGLPPPPPPARPDSAASHRTSNSRATLHGYPGYGGDSYYKSSGGRRAPGTEMYDPQSYYYYYYSPYFEQHPKYRDYCQNYFKHYPHQYGPAGAPHSLPDERGSVRSGRSSAAEEVKKATLNSSRAMEGAPYYDPYGLYPHHQHDTSSGDVSGRASVEMGAPRPPSQRLTPTLFPRSHTITRFTNTGQLLIVVPTGDATATKLSVLSVRDVLLQDGDARRQIRALEAFPGPLTAEDTHKDKVMRFCESKQQHYRDLCSNASSGRSLEQLRSYSLLWRYLALLVRQNGKLCPADLAGLLVESANEAHEEDLARTMSKMALNNEDEEKPTGDGDDGAGVREGDDAGLERLTSSVSQTSLTSSVHGHSTASSWDIAGTKQSRCDSTFDVSKVPRSDLSRCVPQLSPHQLERVNQQLGELVCLGRRRDAVELAIENRLWGHAMAIGSRMEQAVGGRVLSAFLQCLPQHDVVHTLVQQVNGKRPDVSKSYSRSRWGEWRRHLATLVANPSPAGNRDVAAVIALGDSLAGSDIAAGHVCYLMGGGLSVWGHKLQLLGQDPSTARLGSLDSLTSTQCTEVYEYGLNLASAALDTSGAAPAVVTLSGFARHKLRYATLLAEYGFFEQAVRYCEVLAGSLPCPGGVASLPVEEQVLLVSQLYELSARLKYHDRHYLLGEGEIHDMPDPQWLTNLHMYYYHLQQHQAQVEQIPQTGEETQRAAQEYHEQEQPQQHLLQDTASAPPPPATEHHLLNGGHLVSNSAPPFLPPPEDSVAVASSDTIGRTSICDPRMDNSSVQAEAPPSGLGVIPTLPVEDQTPRGEVSLQQQPVCQDSVADALKNFSFQPQLPVSSHSRAAHENHNAVGSDGLNEGSKFGDAGRNSEPNSPHFTPTHFPSLPHQMPQPPYESDAMYTSLPAELPPDCEDEPQYPDQTLGYTSLPSVGHADAPSPIHRQQVPQSSAPPTSTTPTPSSSDQASGKETSSKTDASDGNKLDVDNKGFLSRIFGWKNNQAKLPDDKNPSIVWDEDRKRWVNTDGTDESEVPPPPPPMDSSLPPVPTVGRGGPRRSRYVNPVDEKHLVKSSASFAPPLFTQQQQLLPSQQQTQTPSSQQQLPPQALHPQMMPQQPQIPPQQQQQLLMPQQQQQQLLMPQQQPQQQQQQLLMPQQQQAVPPAQEQLPLQQLAPPDQQTDVAAAIGSTISHPVMGRTRSDSSSIDLDDVDASASQDDTGGPVGAPVFFNPAQFQQQQQQLCAGRVRGAPANPRRGKGGGPQRRAFPTGGAAPPPPRA